jgi:CheY-like chemotaxis protein
MPSQRALRVLVVDDDPIQQRIAARLLRELGHSGALAGNGERALQILQQQPFDAILLDLNMPVLDGMATLAALRSQSIPAHAHPPVVLVSGDDLLSNWDYYRSAGATSYLQKPLDIHALSDRLQRLG